MKLKGEIGKSTITVADLNTPFATTDRTSRQKLKNIVDLKNTISELHLIDKDRKQCPSSECTFSPSAHEIVIKIGHMWGQQASLKP